MGVARLARLPGFAAVLAGFLPAAVADGPVVHDFRLTVGLGYDDNAYLAPRAPYLDQNRPDEGLVDPRKRSGLYSPVRLRGKLERPMGAGRRSFMADYRLNGDFYGDSALQNADETYAKLESGILFRLGNAPRRDRLVDLRAYAAYKKDLYFDRDTGDLQDSDGVDVSDRYTYSAVGAEVLLEYEVSRRLDFYVEGLGESRNYEDPAVPDVEPYDHDRWAAAAGARIRLADRARLKLEYGFDVREYDLRPARSLDGDDPVTNPLLEYNYRELRAELLLRPRDPWILEVRWGLKNRTDGYLDYSEYDQESFRIRSRVRTDRVNWRFSAEYWTRDSPRAFIFDEVVHPVTNEPNPFKAYDAVEIALAGSIPWREHLNPFAKVEWTDRDSTDPRFDYRRIRGMTGFEFRY